VGRWAPSPLGTLRGQCLTCPGSSVAHHWARFIGLLHTAELVSCPVMSLMSCLDVIQVLASSVLRAGPMRNSGMGALG